LGLNLDEKKAVVAEVSAEVAKAQGIVVAEYRGLEVGSMTELRAKARKSGVYLRVLKNTLARRAVAGTPFEKLAEQMVGPLVYGISPDPVATAKVLNEFAKANEKLVIKAGAMPNAVISAKDVKARLDAVARATHRPAARDDAGPGREVRADDERGAGAIRAHPRRGPRREGQAGCGRLGAARFHTDSTSSDSGETKCP